MKDIYIEALEFACNNLNTPITPDVFCNHMNSAGFEGKIVFGQPSLLLTIFNQIFTDEGNAGKRYFATLDAYFHFIEHKELVEARKTSRLAFIMSFSAIIISIGVAIFTVIMPVTIDTNQMKSIQSLSFDSGNIENSIKKLEATVSNIENKIISNLQNNKTHNK